MSDEKQTHIHTVWPTDMDLESGLYAYRVGYRKAAEALVWRAVNEEMPMGEAKGIVYPIMFLYRHVVEITLKDILAQFDSHKSNTRSYKFGHNLAAIWSNVVDVVFEVQEKDIAQDFINCFGPLIESLHAIDPKGDGFRYYLDTTGKVARPEPINVDLINIRMWI